MLTSPKINMAQQSFECDLIIRLDMAVIYIKHDSIDYLTEDLGLKKTSRVIDHIMSPSGIETADSLAILQSHGILGFIAVALGISASDKRQIFGRQLTYALKGIAYKAIFQTAFFLISHMSETTAAAEFINGAIRGDTVRRALCKAFHLAIAI